MGNVPDKQVNLGPLYFNACNGKPVLAETWVDRFNKHLVTPEEVQIMEKVFPSKKEVVDEFKVPSSSMIFTVVSTDAECILVHNDYEIKVGQGSFTIIRAVAWATSFTIRHKGNFTVHFYELDSEDLFALSEVGYFNFYLPGPDGPQLYAYGGGAMGKTEKPLDSFLKAYYNHEYVKATTKSGYVYSMTIENLQNHKSMFENEKAWDMGWDKDLIRQSYPPCIAVSLKATEIENFKTLAREICPDCTFQGFKDFDSKEVDIGEETKNKQIEENMKFLSDNTERLIQAGFLSRTPCMP